MYISSDNVNGFNGFSSNISLLSDANKNNNKRARLRANRLLVANLLDARSHPNADSLPNANPLRKAHFLLHANNLLDANNSNIEHELDQTNAG